MLKSFFALSFATLTLFALGIDSYQSRNSFEALTSINSNTVGVLFIVTMLFYRARNWKIPPIIGQVTRWLVFPISLIVCLIMSAIDYPNPENYAFSLVPIQYQHLGVVALMSGALALITSSINWRSIWGKMTLFAIPFAMMALFFVMNTWDFNFYIEFNKEDHFVEYAQVVVLLVATVTGLAAAGEFKRLSKMGFFWLFVLGSLMLFVIALEEISWGQRLLGLESPEVFAERNVQGEITFHNLDTFSQIIWQSYFVLSFIASFAWLSRKYVEKKSELGKVIANTIIPSWQTASYFFIPWLYYYSTRPGKDHTIGRFGESIELILYLGVAIFLWQSLSWLKKQKSLKPSS